jgi:ferritin-like metal-binding protein YciE
MKKLNNLTEVLAFLLEGLYDAEKKVQHTIPTCIEAIKLPALKEEIKKYGELSSEKRSKLKRIFSYLLVQPFKIKNRVIDMMLKDTHELLEHATTDDLRETVLLSCIQSINHYKLAGYTTALAFALELNQDNVCDLLHEILEWEKDSNTAFTRIAFEALHNKPSTLTPWKIS